MAEKLRLGIIGMSDGNGHPYSWSAIFNGYDEKVMSSCPFPVIPVYLSQQVFPEAGLSHLGKVTHIWTQNREISRHVANACYIEKISNNMEDMIPFVDAILFARDDAENHYRMTMPFLSAGCPIFIDKPLALTLTDANRIFASEKYKGQIFTCSALRFASELLISDEERLSIGEIKHVEGSIMKAWTTYAVHLIEPIISQLPSRGALVNVNSSYRHGIANAIIEWQNLSGYIKTTGNCPTPTMFTFYGVNGSITKLFSDSFACFKKSLAAFVSGVTHGKTDIPREETLEIIQIIERAANV